MVILHMYYLQTNLSVYNMFCVISDATYMYIVIELVIPLIEWLTDSSREQLAEAERNICVRYK